MAILDAGKNRLKLSVVDPKTLETLHVRAADTPGHARPSYQHLDHEMAEGCLIGASRDCPERRRIGVILPLGHGATALLQEDGAGRLGESAIAARG